MSQRMIDLLILQYPGKTHLTAADPAKVLTQHPYTVRERRRNGELPKATKNNGIWEISIPDLAEIREPTNKAPQIPATPVVVGGARRRKAVVMNFRRDRFWAQVARALGDVETADALDRRAQAEYDEQVRLYLLERAGRHRAGLRKIAGQARPLESSDEEPSGL